MLAGPGIVGVGFPIKADFRIAFFGGGGAGDGRQFSAIDLYVGNVLGVHRYLDGI